MHWASPWIEANILFAWLLLLFSFAVLALCAGCFVEALAGVSCRLRLPKLLVGLGIGAVATTAPEFSVSLLSSIQGRPEIALGNAIGSVICDDGLALGLLGLTSLTAIAIDLRQLRTTGVFLLVVQTLLVWFVAFDATLSRWEGATLLLLFAGYLGVLYRQHRRGDFRTAFELEAALAQKAATMGKVKMAGFFVVGLAGILVASDSVVLSARAIAVSWGVSDGIIAMTLVALGTSVPEVATCVAAARRGEGALAVGNILGADIMNICWVAGASALANPLTIPAREAAVMLPAMAIMVLTMLGLLRWGYRLTRGKSLVLLALYGIYLAVFLAL